jgi:hypothetical protein
VAQVATEHEHLEQAERQIAEAESRVAGQRQLIEGMLAGGQDVTIAKRLLGVFERNLEAHRNHRDLILKQISEGRY